MVKQLMQQTMAVAWAHKTLPKNPRGLIHEKVEAAKSGATKRRRKRATTGESVDFA